MEHRKLQIYGNDYIEKPIISERSILYSLEPIGLGTPYVESLTSYITRLAYTHNISVKKLLDIIFSNGSPKTKCNYKSAGLYENSSGINGVGRWAREFVTRVSKYTSRDDIKYLSLLSWSNILPNRNLLRIPKAYCPYCYENAKVNNHETYDMLLWNFKNIKICPVHKSELLFNCFYEDCGKAMTHLNKIKVPGYCPRCKRSLAKSKKELIDQKEKLPSFRDQIWIINQIEQLILEMQNLEKKPKLSSLLIALKQIKNIYAYDSMTTLSSILDISVSTIENWIYDNRFVSMSSLLKICSKLNLSLSKLLAFGKLQSLNSKPIQLQEEALIFSIISNRKVDKNKLESELYNILNNSEIPPPSLIQIASRLELTKSIICNSFPILCKELTIKREKYYKTLKKLKKEDLCNKVKELIYAIHSQERYPSQELISNEIGDSFLFLRDGVQDIWERTLQDLGWR